MARPGLIALMAPLLAAAGLPASQRATVVVYESGVEAYEEILKGLAAVLGPNSFRAVDLQAATAERDLAGALDNTDVRRVIAVGSRAVAEVRAHHAAAPLVSTAVLGGGEPEAGAGRVDLEVPLAAELGAMRTLWPGHTRVGIIRHPAVSRYSAEVLETRARKEGFLPVVVECDGPAHLLKAVAALKGKADFVLCFPDPDLYNAVTIKPLVLAALEDRLPLVGFSPAFVRAGAVVGIYPDYREVGRQAAEMALHLARGEPRGEESPRKIRVAVNQRITRLLGVEFRTDGLDVEVLR
ncbi:MAG TPA: ABC transporter substrate binding protein [Bryobacteraceae bacterium]|nr:ABC transporter substrate binding protein [Bryobacteraceae bacterium]